MTKGNDSTLTYNKNGILPDIHTFPTHLKSASWQIYFKKKLNVIIWSVGWQRKYWMNCQCLEPQTKSIETISSITNTKTFHFRSSWTFAHRPDLTHLERTLLCHKYTHMEWWSFYSAFIERKLGKPKMTLKWHFWYFL